MPSAAVQFYVDGGVIGRNPSATGVYYSVVVIPPDARPQWVCEREADYGYTTNNDAEWLAVLRALRYAADHYAGTPIVIYSDSRLVTRQFAKQWRVRIERHHRLMGECRQLAHRFPTCWVVWKRRDEIVAKLGH